MIETFNLTINQILMMFLFMLAGYAFQKKKIGGDSVSTVLSALLVNIFLPCVCFKSFSDNCTVKGISENISFLYAGIAVIVFAFFLAKLFSKVFGEDEMQKDVYMYSFLIPNIGYMGYPIVEAVFGELALFKMMIFVIPFQFMIFTYGIYVLNPNKEWNIKRLFNPNIIAIALGILFGLSGLKLPAFLDKAVISAKGCMSPTAMILTGFVLGGIPIKPVFLSVKSYIAAIVRGILIPAICFIIMYLMKIDSEIILISTATLAMPFGLNSIVFPEAFGGDSKTGASTCFISTVVSIMTIPVVFALLQYFLKF